MSVHTVLFAQSDISSKLSIATQMFLNDRDSKNANMLRNSLCLQQIAL